MESLTYFKNLKISPKKMRMFRDIVVKMRPQEALAYLQYTPTKSARMYYKVLHSAVANATQVLKVQPDMVQFKLLTIEEGRRLKRYRAGSKGMAKPMAREYCHVKVILVEVPHAKKTTKAQPVEKKIAAKSTEKKAAKETSSKEKKSAVKKPAASKKPAEVEKEVKS